MVRIRNDKNWKKTGNKVIWQTPGEDNLKQILYLVRMHKKGQQSVLERKVQGETRKGWT